MFYINTVLIVIISILLFVSIIVIHEFGHFIVAKACNIRVNEFAIGMGPKLFKVQGKETLFTVRLIPIGGYCAMEGEDEGSDDPRAFCNKKVWQRFLVVVAGATFNIILGLIFMMLITVQEPVYTSTTVASFADTAVSNYEGGLMAGDKITSVNGYKVLCAQDLSFGMQFETDGTMDFDIVRSGKKMHLDEVKFNTREVEDIGTATVIDFYVQPIERNVLTVLQQSGLNTLSFVRIVYASLSRLITGQYGMGDLSGPVGTASIIGEAATEGFKVDFMSGINNILNIMALITVNLGIFNLLPIPALDGGRLVFLIVEGIRRKPIKHEGLVHAIGFAALILFMVFVTYNDIIKLIKGA